MVQSRYRTQSLPQPPKDLEDLQKGGVVHKYDEDDHDDIKDKKGLQDQLPTYRISYSDYTYYENYLRDVEQASQMVDSTKKKDNTTKKKDTINKVDNTNYIDK